MQINCDDKITYTKGKEFILPKCRIVNEKREQDSHLVLYYKMHYYDTEHMDFNNIISYLKITVG